MKYRKKPVVIDAIQWHKSEIHPEINIKDKLGVYAHKTFSDSPVDYRIDTLEGWHNVIDGDWIITGVKGERYPCKPDIFEMTYEKV